MKMRLSGVGLLAATLAFGTCAQAAEQAAPATSAASDQAATQSAVALAANQPLVLPLIRGSAGWIKFCQDEAKGQCSVSGGFAFGKGLPDSFGFSVATGPDPVHEVNLLLPLSLNLRTGFVLAVGKTTGYVGTYTICRPVGCTGVLALTDDAYRSMLAERTLSVIVQNELGRTVTMEGPLDGFAEAVKGSAMSMADVNKRREEAVKELNKQRAANDAQAAATPPAPAPDKK